MLPRQWYLAQQRYYQQLALPVVAVILVIGLTAMVLVPQVKGMIDDQREIRQMRQEVAALAEKATLLANLDPAELEVKSQKLTASLPHEDDLGYFLTAIRSMAQRAGVEFRGVELVAMGQVQPANPAGVAQVAHRSAAGRRAQDETRLSVSLDGGVRALRQFLEELERSIPLALAAEFSFVKGQGNDELTAKLMLRYFYSGLPERLGTVEQPLQVITAAEEQVYDRLVEFREPEIVELPRVPTGNQQLML